MKAWRRICCGLLGLGVVPFSSAVPVDSELRAGLVYRFSQFSSREQPNVLQRFCVAGNPEVAEALSGLLRHSNQLVSQIEQAEQAQQCDVLYLDSSVGLPSLWQPVFGYPALLTIVDSHEFFRLGAVFGLITEPHRIGFRVNLSLARERGFHLSAQMLKLAKEVY